MIAIRLDCGTPDSVLADIEAFYDDDARCYSNDRPDQYHDMRSWICAVTDLARRHVWIFYDDDDRPRIPIGVGGIRDHGEPGTCELFIVIDPLHRDHGYGQQVAFRLCQLGHEIGYHRVEARVDLENTRGLSCMQRAGLDFEGIQRGLLHQRPDGTVWRDYALYANLDRTMAAGA